MQRQKFAPLIRVSRVLSLSLLVVILGGLLKPEAAVQPVSFGAKTAFGTGSVPHSVAVGDFNDDGKLDLAVANVNAATVSILLSTGTGSFGAKTDFGTGTGSGPRSVAVRDYNGDGKLDLAVANGHSNTVSILLGTGTGSFGAKTDFSTGSFPESVTVGDFDGDGKLDLAVSNLGAATVSILLNNVPPSITAAPVTRTAGNPSANSQIATVDDAQDALNVLSLTVDGGTSATVNGVTVTLNPTAPDASGQVFADVVAACAATTANFTLRVTDSCGLFTETTLTVTVNPDNQPPTITCPANITRSNDPNQCGAVVNYPPPTITDNCPGAFTAMCSPPSGSFFPVGTTTVTSTVDGFPASTCTFTVTVNDTQPPTITCPANVTSVTPVPGGGGAVVTFPPPTASDNCPGVTSVCSPPSGSTFPVGTATVTCTATDASGNTATCSFTVTEFDVCLQDESNSSRVLLLNSQTGDYRFCCGGMTFTGRGTVARRGSVFTLTDNSGNRRVSASLDSTQNKGSASLQSPPGVTKCTIMDRDIRNNSCSCSGGS